jgi:hypothetical protein
MTFRPDVVRGVTSGAPTGVVDYRLQRNGVVKEYKKGRLTRLDVCDAHPELIRNAKHASRPATEECPICETPGQLVLVTYVFGSKLPPSGRCILSPRELAKLDRGRADLAAYVVEVCRTCNWNHLLQSFPVGGRTGRS